MRTYLHASAAMIVLFAIWYGCDSLESYISPVNDNVLSTVGFFLGAVAAFAVVQIHVEKK